MKPKLILTCAMVAILLSLCACSPAPKQVSVDVSYDGNEVEIAVGGSLTVTLESNPISRFQWDLTEITDQTVLAEVGHEFKPPEAGAPMEVGGEEVWTFKALKAGESIISMEREIPWICGGGEKAVETFNLTVVVK